MNLSQTDHQITAADLERSYTEWHNRGLTPSLALVYSSLLVDAGLGISISDTNSTFANVRGYPSIGNFYEQVEQLKSRHPDLYWNLFGAL
jgi:hypothetical protein